MNKFILAALSISTLAVSSHTLANSGQITFTGVVNEKTCTIDTTSSNLTVLLPGVATTDFDGANSTAGSAVPFSIKVTNCDSDLAQAGVLFGLNQNVDTATGNLKNTLAEGTDAQIRLFSASGKTINLANFADNMEFANADANGNVSMDFTAKYYTVGATPKAGLLKTNIEYVVQYK
jgi:major type 1 subunit fimbrin (pilin)